MQRIMILGLAALFCAAAAVAGDSHEHGAAAPTDPRFEFLKGLAGTWVGKTSMPEMPETTYEFRVTAGGTAVEEREMVGTPMEMVTLYHMRGDELVATHYCMLGNQPRMNASKLVGDSLSFACDGTPGNARSHDEEHVHGWTMRLEKDGSLHYAAELVKKGQVTEAPSIVLTRQTETASR
jgi:hypothetical protein